MTVKEVIKKLQEYDEDMEVKVFCGTINEVVTVIAEDIEDGCPVVSNW